jgi:uroporphyrinogen decarboxylase
MSSSHRERLEITLSGGQPDRPPIALWHHFPVDDQNAITLAEATIAFQKQFDFDLVKVMPPSSFCLKDWGAMDEWRGHPEGTRTYTHRVIAHPEDWTNLPILNPHQGYLGQQLKCLDLLQTTFTDHTPVLQTIFNPLSQAKNLVGPSRFLEHIRLFPDAVHQGLRTIQETTLRFIEAAKGYGIAGIFYAIQHASYYEMSKNEYKTFGVSYDLPILETVKDLWANMAHIHGESIMFELIAKYPVQILNWHDRETSPSLEMGLAQFPGAVCGGISRIESLTLGTPKTIQEEVRQAIEKTGGKRLILGTGCVLPLTTPFGNIMTARKAVEGEL